MLQLLGRGLQHKEIAHELSISANTVKNYVSRATEKLGARSTVHAVVMHEISVHRRCGEADYVRVAKPTTQTGRSEPT